MSDEIIWNVPAKQHDEVRFLPVRAPGNHIKAKLKDNNQTAEDNEEEVEEANVSQYQYPICKTIGKKLKNPVSIVVGKSKFFSNLCFDLENGGFALNLFFLPEITGVQDKDILTVPSKFLFDEESSR